MNQINELIKIAKDAAKDIIEIRGEYHEPSLIMDCPNGLTHVIKFNRMNESVKANLQPKLKALLAEHKATAYIFVFEGWTAEEEATKKASAQGQTISDLPLDDRTEVLQMIVCEKGKQPWGIICNIQDTPQGRRLSEYRKVDVEGKVVATDW